MSRESERLVWEPSDDPLVKHLRVVSVEELEEAEWNMERDRITQFLRRKAMEAKEKHLSARATIIIQLVAEIEENKHRPQPSNAELWR